MMEMVPMALSPSCIDIGERCAMGLPLLTFIPLDNGDSFCSPLNVQNLLNIHQVTRLPFECSFQLSSILKAYLYSFADPWNLGSGYRDILHPDKKPFYLKGKEDSDIMDAYLMHSLNHTFRTRDLVTKDNAKLAKLSKNNGDTAAISAGLLDHGFTRPKVGHSGKLGERGFFGEPSAILDEDDLDFLNLEGAPGIIEEGEAEEQWNVGDISFATEGIEEALNEENEDDDANDD
ncbi:U3 small nucleolar RNA-associated protein 25 [Nymphaea thermarum]|nr:U3 small nucleolar RNA-associated protein 25 [Nymphaea thermarum]